MKNTKNKVNGFEKSRESVLLLAFSLVEVIIATSIITITVFGVYKLIGENTKIITHSGNYSQLNSLFPVLEECIENIGFDNYGAVGQQHKFDFGADNTSCILDGSDLVFFDGLDYSLNGKVLAKTAKYIDWELSISSDEIKAITSNYKQIKK